MVEPSGHGNLPRFTARETEVLKFLARGLPDAEISRSLEVSRETVVNHTRNILEKLRLQLQLVSS